MFSCLQILEAFLWFVLITLLNVTLIILTLRSEERFSRNAETDLVCRLLLEKKNIEFLISYLIFVFFSLVPHHPRSTLFPYTTLFRSTVKLMVLALICLGNNRQD